LLERLVLGLDVDVCDVALEALDVPVVLGHQDRRSLLRRSALRTYCT
jgi:hypothetical protein